MASSGLRLLMRQGPRVGQAFDLNKPAILIGREAGSDIVIEDPQVSRHHTKLTQQGAGYIIEDLGSTNGTFIDGRRVMTPTLLSVGNKLGLGDTVVLEVQPGMLVEQPVMPPPPPAPAYGPSRAYSAPPPAYSAPPPPPPSVDKKGPSGWVWGCGCLVGLVVFVVVVAVVGYFLAPKEIAGPVCQALSQVGLGMLCK